MKPFASFGLPKVAVVCAAHTQLGKQVTRQLIRSPHIAHIYALSELDIRDDPSISSLPKHVRKLTLLIHPLDFLERTISASIREVDLAFCCLCSPRHVLPSLGAYLFHKLNFDIPLRFVQQMTRMQAHSVAIFSHPSASPTSRSNFLRVKGELIHAVRKFQHESFPSVPRVAVFEVPILLSDFRRPLEHHATDHMHNGAPPPPVSAFDRIKQKAVLKHHADTSAPVHIRDAAYALVADAVHSLDTFVRDDIMQAQQDAQLFITLDPSTIVELANAARALRKKRISTGANHDAMRDKMSNFAKRELQTHDTPTSSHPSSPHSTTPDRRTARNASTRHSVDALGAQIARNVSVLADNPLLPDVEANKYGKNKPKRTQSHHERTKRHARTMQEGIQTPPLASPPLTSPPRGSLESTPASTPRRFSQASSPRDHRPFKIRSFHAGTHQQRARRSSIQTDRRTSEQTEERKRQGGRFAAVVSAFTDKVFTATERPNVHRARQRRELDQRRRNSAPTNEDSRTDSTPRRLPVRGNGDLREVGQTTI